MKTKEKQREHWKNWYKRNKAEQRKRIKQRLLKNKKWYIKLKKSLRCSKCGENDYRCLEFHHKSDKGASLSNALKDGWSIKRMEKEIKKCIVLCSNCHRKKHYKENSF